MKASEHFLTKPFHKNDLGFKDMKVWISYFGILFVDIIGRTGRMVGARWGACRYCADFGGGHKR
jgi:hypothetical protein